MANCISMRKCLLVMGLVGLIGILGGTAPAQEKILDVKLFPQETNMWCWAASAQMVMDFHGKKVRQYVQANNRFGCSDCGNNPVPSHCVQGGWPEFEKYGFDCNVTSNSALSWQDVKKEIDNNRPIAFTWHWNKGGGGHVMVLRGYTTINNRNWVLIHEPLPQGIGGSKTILYSAYVSGSFYTHWNDYYNIRPVPTGITVASAKKSQAPPAVSWKTSANELPPTVDVKALHSAVKDSRPVMIKARVMFEGATEDVPGAGPKAIPGGPIPIHLLGLNELRGSAPDVGQGLLVKNGVGRMIYPMVRDKKVVSAVTLERSEEKGWGSPSFGGATMTRLYVQAQQELTKAVEDSSSPPFAVAVPSLNFYAVAIQRKGGALVALPVIAYPELGLKQGQIIQASKLLPVLVDAAKKHDGLPR